MLKGIYKFGFVVLLVLGTLIVLSAETWFYAWLGLEMNMLAFIPLMMRTNNSLNAEAGLKYFLVQASASLMLLMVVLAKEVWVNTFLETGYEGIKVWGLGLILAVSMGMAPVHFWFPDIVEHLSWSSLMILLIWQKIAPLTLMSNVAWAGWGSSVLILCSVAVGGVGGLIQTSLTKLIAYSSIAHMGWMVGAMKLGENEWMIYFGVYAILTFSVVWNFSQENCYELAHLWLKNSFSDKTKLSMCLSVLSMGGLPPFLGFFPKWMVISGLMQLGETPLVLFMVLMAVVTLYYYFRMVFVICMHLNTSPSTEFFWPAEEGGVSTHFFQWGSMGIIGLNLSGLGLILGW
uniref:NADH dehydrogenase subunit 2 n=1 Tax=Cordax unidentatus TaxID=3021430 RepID=UPI0030FECE9E|nr:NADH dehydrogenase subunit 2 [Cordax unidentatus]